MVSPGAGFDAADRRRQHRGIPVVGDIELFARAARRRSSRSLAPTAKSTVTVVGRWPRRAGEGRRRRQSRDSGARSARPDIELYVLELSSFSWRPPSRCRRRSRRCSTSAPITWIVLRHGCLCRLQRRVMRGAGVGVLNADDPVVAAMLGADDAWYFTLGESQDVKMFGVCLDR